MRAAESDFPDIAADILERVRARRPRTHCITNAVAQNITANVLLAVGAVPSMTISPDEIAAFAARADALLINLGTFDAERQVAADTGIAKVNALKTPWVLDPVLIDRSPPRADYAQQLLRLKPSALRLNAAEFETLAGTASPEIFAAQNRVIVALTGETDGVTDGSRLYKIANGHPLMAYVTAMGCAGSALVATALAVEPDRLKAVAAALLMFGIAGDIAGDKAGGPGSFAVQFLDALFHLDRATIRARAKVAS